ncbi:uncharacterized protein LOC122259439 isoform X2 [Penaeus japonicus]|uniref:uncharacterized protein LOC122259439 isoform X2 n=1 Tax=Penaeus japonicus TaxID=27405 RepID=UPI001C71350D|nr:uncharacterized protein LOC122259439 isoform X2 [Penaeus japonicus]
MRLHSAPVFLLLLVHVLSAPSRPRDIPNAEAELHLPTTREDSTGGGFLQSILQTLNPFSSRKSRDLDNYLTSFKKRLVREASDLASLYVKAASDVYPVRGGRERRQPERSPEKDFRLSPRAKRDHPLEWPLYEDSDSVPVLAEVAASGSFGFSGGSQKIYMTSWHNRSFVAVIGNSRNVSLYTLDSQTLQATLWDTVTGDVACDFGVVTKDRLLLTCVENTTTSSLVNVYQVLEETEGGDVSLRHHQVIRAEHPIDVKMWTQLDTPILMVAESLKKVNVSVETGSGTSEVQMANYETVSFVYEWAGEYFDAIQQLPGTRPNSVAHIRIHSAHFIAMANFVDNKGRHNIYSTIYKYSLNVGHFVPFQRILTKGAYHFETFVLGTGFGSDTFLAVANHCEDNVKGGCNPHTNSQIYRYRLGKFILYQDIPTSYAVAWLAIQVGGNVILALASSRTGVTFYQFDGWTFVKSTTQYSGGAMNEGVNSLAMLPLPDSIIMGVSNRDPDKVGRGGSNLFTLAFTYTNSLDNYHQRAEEWCQKRRGDTKEQDVADLQSRVASAPRTTSGYVFKQHVTITADLTVSHTANVTSIHVTEPNLHIPADWRRLADLHENVEEAASYVAAKMNDSIFINSPQTWPADLHFADLKVESESEVDNLSVNEVNGLTWPADDDVIRLAGASYSALHSLSFEHVEAKVDTRVTNLTGLPFSSYVTLHGSHNITGNTSFLGVVRTPAIEATSGHVDDLLVRHSSVLTTVGQQEFTGAFTCQSVNALEMDAGTLNGINVNQFQYDVITVDGNHTIYGALSVQELVYQDHLEADVSASIDLVNPLRTDVAVSQEITAVHKLGSLEVEYLVVGGKVNSVKIPEEVFVNGSDYFVGSSSFDNLEATSVQITKSLDQITVSNKKLNILQTFNAQVVTAPKTFTEFHLADTFLKPLLKRPRRNIPNECELSSSSGITDFEDHFERLRGLLQGLSMTKELLLLLQDVQPEKKARVPMYAADFYAVLLDEDVGIPCTLVRSGIVFSEMLELKQVYKASVTVVPYVERTWSADELSQMILKLEEYLEDFKELFISNASDSMTWSKLGQFSQHVRQQMAQTIERDLPLLTLIKKLFDSKNSHRLINPVFSFCEFLCPVTNDESVCHPGILVIRNLIRRIASYPSALETVTAPRQKQEKAQLVSLVVIERDLEALLDYLSIDERLQESLHIASLCGFSKMWEKKDDDENTALEILLAYENELENTFHLRRPKRHIDDGVLPTTTDEVKDSQSVVTDGSTEDTTGTSNFRALSNFAGGEFDASISSVPPDESSQIWNSLSGYLINLENFVNTVYKLDGPFIDTANDEIRKIIHMNIDYLQALDSDLDVGLENASLLERLSESLILGKELMMNYRITPDVANSVERMRKLPWIRHLMYKINEQIGSRPNASTLVKPSIDTGMGPMMPVTYDYVKIINNVFHNLSQTPMAEDNEEDRRQRILLLEAVAEQLIEAKRSMYLSRHAREIKDEVKLIDTLKNILKKLLLSVRSYTYTTANIINKYREELLQISKQMGSVNLDIENISRTQFWEIEWLKDQMIEDMEYCKEEGPLMSRNIDCKPLLNSDLSHTDMIFPFLSFPADKEPDFEVTELLDENSMQYLSAVLVFLNVIEAGLPLQTKVTESQTGLPVIMGFVSDELDSVVNILIDLEHDIWNIGGGKYDSYLTKKVKNFLVACDLVEKYSEHVTEVVFLKMNKILHLVTNVRHLVFQASFIQENPKKSTEERVFLPAGRSDAGESDVLNIANPINSIPGEFNMDDLSEVCSNITIAISEDIIQFNRLRDILGTIQNHLKSLISLWPIQVKVSNHFRLGYSYLSSQSKIVKTTLAKLKSNLMGTITSKEEEFSTNIFKNFANILTFAENSQISIKNETIVRLDAIYMEGSAVLEVVSEALSCLKVIHKLTAGTELDLQHKPTSSSTHEPAFYTGYSSHASLMHKAESSTSPSSSQMSLSLPQVENTISEQVKSSFTSTSQVKTVYPKPRISVGCSEFQAQVESEEHKVLLENLKAAKDYLQILVAIKPFTIEKGKMEVKKITAFLDRVVPKAASVLRALDEATIEKEMLWSGSISLFEAKGLATMLKHVNEYSLILPQAVVQEVRYMMDQSATILEKITILSECLQRPKIKSATVSPLTIASHDVTSSQHDATTILNDTTIPHRTTQMVITQLHDDTTPYPKDDAMDLQDTTAYFHGITSSPHAYMISPHQSTPFLHTTTTRSVFDTKNSRELLYYLEKSLKYLQTLNSSLPWNLHPTAPQDLGFPSYLKTVSASILENLELLAKEPIQLENLRSVFHLRAAQFARMMRYAKSSKNLQISKAFQEQLDHMAQLLQYSLTRVTETIDALKGESPTSSPAASPTFSPAASPTTSPAASPTTSPAASPTTSPAASPTTSPAASPTTSPAASPTTSPAASPTTSPAASPTTSPAASPTTSPAASPTTTLAASPTTTLAASPTTSPAASPTTTPAASPTTSPAASPTTSPISTSTSTTTPSLWEKLVAHHEEKTKVLTTLKEFQEQLLMLTNLQTLSSITSSPTSSHTIKTRRAVPSDPLEAMAATLEVARGILKTLSSLPTSNSTPVYERVVNELQELVLQYNGSSSSITPVTEDDLLRIRTLASELLPTVVEVILLLETEIAQLEDEIEAVEDELLGPILEGYHVGPPLPMSTSFNAPSEIQNLLPSSSRVHGLVSGYKIELVASSLRQPFDVGDNVTEFLVNNMDKIRDVDFRSHLHSGDVNGVNVTRLRESGVALDAARVNVSLTFLQHVEVAGNVTAQSINGVPAGDYVTKDGMFVFGAPLQFVGGAMMKEDVTVTSTVNDVDLSNVTLRMAKVKGTKAFQTDLVFGHVDTESVNSPRVTVSGVRFRDTVKKNESAIITGSKTFLGNVEVKSGPVQAGDVTAETVDGSNVTDLIFGSLRKSLGDLQVIKGGFKIRSLKIEKNLSTRGFTVLPRDDSVPFFMNFTSFSRHVVYRDEDCVINGDLLLFGNTEVRNLGFHDTFDDVPFTRYEDGWLLQKGNQTLKGHLTVASVMNAQRVVTLPGVTVQGVDVDFLNLFAMMVDEPETFVGPVGFELLTSASPVVVDGRVQGWDLSAEGIVQSTSDSSGGRVLVFTGTKNFLGDVFYGADFNVTGLVNGIDIETVCPMLSYHHFHTDSATFLGGVGGEEVHLGKDRLVLDRGFADSFWRSDRPALLPNGVAFDTVAAVHITTNSMVNQVNLKDLDTSVLRKYCAGGSQEVAGSFSFANLTVSSLQSTSIQMETLDEWTANDLLNIMTRDETQFISGQMYFDNVFVLGSIEPFSTVGGLEVSEFCRRGSPCSVEAPKVFANLTVVGNHTVQNLSTVQGVDVSEAFEGAVTNTTCGFIPGRTTFVGRLNMTSLWTPGLVDGVNMTSLELLTLSEGQVMQGALSVVAGSGGTALTVENLTSDDGYFNSMNLTDLWNTAVRLDRENVVSGQVHFQGAVTFQDVELHKTLDGVLALIDSPPDVSALALPYEYTYNISRINHHVLEGQAREFWGWRRVQEFQEPLVRLVPLVMDPLLQGRPSSNTSEYLALITSLGSTKIFKRLEDGRYEDTNVTLSGVCTKNAVGYTSHGKEFVVTGHVCLDITTTDDMSLSGNQEVLIWDITDGVARWTSSVSTPGAADVQVVMLRDTPCLIIVPARGNETLVTCESQPGHFRELQRLTTPFNPVKATVVEHTDPSGRKVTFLGVADEGDSFEHMGSLTVWRYDGEENAFTRLQVIIMDDAKWVEMTSHHSDLFLVLVSGAFRGDQQGQVQIYRMDWFDGDGTQALGHYGTALQSEKSDRLIALRTKPQFYFVQEVAVEQPAEARLYTHPSGELSLYVIGQDGMVVRFSQKGIHRFWKEGELHAPGKVTLDVWSSWVNGRIVHRLNAGGSSCQDIEKKNFPEEPALVLEALFRGGLDAQGQPSSPAGN